MRQYCIQKVSKKGTEQPAGCPDMTPLNFYCDITFRKQFIWFNFASQADTIPRIFIGFLKF